jgi:hypothetical protein
VDVEREAEVGSGEESVIPPGHDAWVVGGEPVVSVDMSSGMAERYGKGDKAESTAIGAGA